MLTALRALVCRDSCRYIGEAFRVRAEATEIYRDNCRLKAELEQMAGRVKAAENMATDLGVAVRQICLAADHWYAELQRERSGA